MRISVGLVIKLVAGGAVAVLLPRNGILEGSTRIIPFFALLMAGVLPAMMQTVTVIKGDDLSPKAVKEYGEALQEQLRFWAALFSTALLAVGSLTLAVIISKADALINLPSEMYLDRDFVVDVLRFGFGCAGTSVLNRFLAAYGGLKSLLRLNLQLAERKSIKGYEKAITGLSTAEIRPSVKTP